MRGYVTLAGSVVVPMRKRGRVDGPLELRSVRTAFQNFDIKWVRLCLTKLKKWHAQHALQQLVIQIDQLPSAPQPVTFE